MPFLNIISWIYCRYYIKNTLYNTYKGLSVRESLACILQHFFQKFPDSLVG